MNLQLVDYKTRYSEEFMPTITFMVRNNGTQTIVAFDIEANLNSSNPLNQCIHKKTFTQILSPRQAITISYTIDPASLSENCTDYPVIDLVREECVDDTANKKM